MKFSLEITLAFLAASNVDAFVLPPRSVWMVCQQFHISTGDDVFHETNITIVSKLTVILGLSCYSQLPCRPCQA